MGKAGTTVLMIVTLGGLGIWAMIDLIMILVGSFRDSEYRRVYHWLEPEENVGKVTNRIGDLERRMTDVQDIVIALDERLQRMDRSSRPSE